MMREEIEAKLLKLQNEKDAFLTAHRAKVAPLVAELGKAGVAAKLATFSDEERKILGLPPAPQTIRPAGVESQEAVGTK